MFSHEEAHHLVAAIRQGDAAAFARLVRDTRPALLAYCERIIHSATLAEDIVQDVFTAQWIRRAEWSIHGSLIAYLRRAVRNRALDVVQEQHAAHAVTTHVPPLASPESSDARVLSADLEAIVLDIVGTLPLRCRQVFLLCGAAGYSRKRVAQELQIALSTVNYYLMVSRQQILRALYHRGVDIPSWLHHPELVFDDTFRDHHPGHSSRTIPTEVVMTVDPARYDPAIPFSTVKDVSIVHLDDRSDDPDHPVNDTAT